MNKAYLLLGGNLGNKQGNLKLALDHIEKYMGKVVRKSSVYLTAPWGFTHEEAFLNQAVLVQTKYNPQELLEESTREERIKRLELNVLEKISKDLNCPSKC